MKLYSILFLSLVSCGGKQNDDKGLDENSNQAPSTEVDANSGATKADGSDYPFPLAQTGLISKCKNSEENIQSGCELYSGELIPFNEKITSYQITYQFSPNCPEDIVIGIHEEESKAFFQLFTSSNPKQSMKLYGRGPYKLQNLHPKDFSSVIIPKSCQLIITEAK